MTLDFVVTKQKLVLRQETDSGSPVRIPARKRRIRHFRVRSNILRGVRCAGVGSARTVRGGTDVVDVVVVVAKLDDLRLLGSSSVGRVALK